MRKWLRENSDGVGLVLFILCVLGALVGGIVVLSQSQGAGLAPCYEGAFLIEGQCTDYRHTLKREGLFWVCRCEDSKP